MFSTALDEFLQIFSIELINGVLGVQQSIQLQHANNRVLSKRRLKVLANLFQKTRAWKGYKEVCFVGQVSYSFEVKLQP